MEKFAKKIYYCSNCAKNIPSADVNACPHCSVNIIPKEEYFERSRIEKSIGIKSALLPLVLFIAFAGDMFIVYACKTRFFERFPHIEQWYAVLLCIVAAHFVGIVLAIQLIRVDRSSTWTWGYGYIIDGGYTAAEERGPEDGPEPEPSGRSERPLGAGGEGGTNPAQPKIVYDIYLYRSEDLYAKWACRMCDAENDRDAQVCDVCGYLKTS